MKITQITVGYGETQSLPEYCNVKPSITLTAALEDGEDEAVARQQLMALARRAVHEEVDNALEDAGRKTKYYQGPTYQVFYSTALEIYVVAPDGARQPNTSYSEWGAFGLRLERAITKAQQKATEKGYAFVDCSDGDLSRLPTGEKATDEVVF